jgi:hypothetical protein
MSRATPRIAAGSLRQSVTVSSLQLVPARAAANALADADANLSSPAAPAMHAPARRALRPPAELPPAEGRTGGEAAAPDAARSEFDGYLPRKMLTAGAAPLENLQVKFPAEVPGIVDLRVNISLFIDEQGQVRRVRFDTSDIAPGFAAAIRETFGPARFKPGELDGVPVRSQLPLQVEFTASR